MIDFIIVGHGIGGTCMAHVLLKKQLKVLVIDGGQYSATRVAAGNINPITGRHYTKSWQIDTLIKCAKDMYEEMSQLTGQAVFKANKIYRTLRSVKEENNWMARTVDEAYQGHCTILNKDTELDQIIRPPQAYGVVEQALQVDTNSLLDGMRTYLLSHNAYLSETFDYDQFAIDNDFVKYRGYIAKGIIFAEGRGMVNNPYFNMIPIEPTKGEALIISMQKTLTANIRDKCFVTPLGQDYWAGAGYEWVFEDDGPSEMGRAKIEAQLDAFMTVPYKVRYHVAGVRPCTKDRRPLIGRHHVHHNLYLLNGLGTKGTSLAPWCATQLGELILYNKPIHPEVNLMRYVDKVT